MNAVLSAGGRFHAFYLARQLAKRNVLKKIFTFSAQQSDFAYLSKDLVQESRLCKITDFLATRFHVRRFLNKSWCNATQDALFDAWTARKIEQLEPFDLFVGWADYILKTIPIVRQKGAKIILESGSFHIKDQAELLAKAYDQWGISYVPMHKKNIDRMLAEYELVDYIMTPSDVVCQSFYRQGISQEKILKVPCGVDIAYFAENGVNRMPAKKFIVLFAGLLSIRKGVPYLIQAWNMLNLPQDMAELVLVGAMQKDCLNVLKRLTLKKNITIVGPVSHKRLTEYYLQASVLVLPSLDEGFGMVVSEAMASGLPVICSDHVGAAELINNYENGFVVPYANTQALAAALDWCYQYRDECFEMGKRAEQKIAPYTLDWYGQQTYHMYEKILQATKA